MNRRKRIASTVRHFIFIAWIAAVVNCGTAAVTWAAPTAGQFQLASAGSSDSEVEAKNNFGLADLTDQYGLDSSQTLSGVNAYVRSDGGSGSWRAGYSLDLGALQQVIDKGDLQAKVKFDALSYDGSLDDDWLYFKLEQKAANGSATTLKYIGDGENGTEKYFDDLQDWQNNLDLGWFNLSSGTRSLQLTFSSDDDDQEAGARNIRVYFKDKNRPLLNKISSDAVPGTFTGGQSIALKFEFDEPVTVDTTQTIAMNTGGSAVYVSGNQSNVLTYSYTVRSGDQQSALGFSNNPVTIVDQTLNAVDLSGNETIDTAARFQNVLASSQFAVDGVPPAVNGSLTTSSVRDTVLKAGEAADISIYFTEPVNVTGSPELHFNNGGTAVSTGIGSGVDHLTFRYTVDAADQDTAALDFASSGAFTGGTIVDAAGNAIQDRAVSGLLAQNIRIDRTPPGIAFSAANALVYRQSHTVRVDVSDTNGSGPDDLFSYYWSADSAPVSNWSGVTALTAAPGTELTSPADVTGDYYLHVKAHDKAGNETVETQNVKIDNTKPAVAVDPDGSTAPAQKYAVRIVASDGDAGINDNQIKYQWLKDNAAVDDSKWTAGNLTDAIESDLTGASQSGQWKLAVRVEDQAGNRTDFISSSYLIDLDAPAVTVTPAGDAQYERSYQVTVNAQDAGGVQSVSYIWTDSTDTPGPGAGWKSASSGNAFTSDPDLDGSYYLHLDAADAAGNHTVLYKPFLFDNTPPEISLTENTSSTPSKTASAQVSAADAHTAVQLYYKWTQQGETVSPEDSGWQLVTALSPPQKTGGDGPWIVHVKAVDAAGNVAVASGSNPYVLDNTAPTGGVTIARAMTKEHVIPLQLAAQDETSGLGGLEYNLSADNGAVWSGWKSYTADAEAELPDAEGSYTVQVKFRDEAGNESPVYSADVTIDRTAPAASVQYSITTPTKQSVTATLVQLSDNVSQADKLKVTNNNGELVRTFTSNGDFTFTLEDEAGNEAQIAAAVSWIYEENVEIVLSQDGNAIPAQSAAVTASVTNSSAVPVDADMHYQWSQDPVPSPTAWKPAAAGTYQVEGQTRTMIEKMADDPNAYRFTLTGGDGSWYLHIQAFDSDQAATVRSSRPFELDNTPPAASLSYTPDTATGSPVTAYISFPESVTILQPEDGRAYHVFEENGTYEFTYSDAAGNIGTSTASVDWIDSSLPTVNVDYSTRDWTNQPVQVTVEVYGNSDRTISSVDMPLQMQATLLDRTTDSAGTVTSVVYEVRNNGTFYVNVTYPEMERIDRIPVTVSNIDLIAPVGTLTYSTQDWTREDVTVSMAVYDSSGSYRITSEGGASVHTFTENGQFTFTFTDAAGNTGEAVATVSNIDKTPPDGTVTYSSTQWTNQGVTATLAPSDNSGEPVVIVNNGGSPQRQFDTNGEFVYQLRDAAGNTKQVTATVANIDKTSPAGTVTYSVYQTQKTNQDVTATLTMSDTQTGVHVVNNGGSPVRTFTENGVFDFEIEDEAGNAGIVRAVVSNIDKTVPTAQVTYSAVKLTNKDVLVTVKPSEKVTVKNNDGKLTYTYTANGAFDFVLADEAGNESQIHTEVNYIDKTPPVGTVAYSTTEPTNQPVTVTVAAGEPFMVANNQNKTERVFYQNASYEFTIVDEAGNIGTVTAVVGNIDNTPPQASVAYSETGLTNMPVTATVTAGEPITMLNNNGQNQYVFKENGTFTFVISDALGNQTTVNATVKNMDTTPPVLRFGQQTPLTFLQNGTYQLSDVEADDSLEGSLNDRIAIDPNGFDIGQPGAYTVIYTVSDSAGNTARAERQVTVVGANEKQVFVNGAKLGTEPIIVAGSKLEFQAMNAEGALQIKWKKGKLTKGDMKSGTQELTGTVFQADAPGWYTFYIQDQERSTVLALIYISSM